MAEKQKKPAPPQDEFRAFARGVPMSGHKARLVVDLVRGRLVKDALAILENTPKRAAFYVKRVLRSASRNAESLGGDRGLDTRPENLAIKRIVVDEGVMMKRWKARARGSVSPIMRRTCHISVILTPWEKPAPEDDEPAETILGPVGEKVAGAKP
ncbi:MAG: 50S ribosomal protein L22 [Planctomycetes bacterium]|nr:50S ribosomal protein L22 [Planctomycetota bacterium]